MVASLLRHLMELRGENITSGGGQKLETTRGGADAARETRHSLLLSVYYSIPSATYELMLHLVNQDGPKKSRQNI